MRKRRWLRRGGWALGLALCLAGTVRGEAGSATTAKVAVADFSYLDTSGEARDQTAEHAARLKAFTERLRAELAAAGTYRLVRLNCEGNCPSADSGLPELIEEARRAGADIVVFGGIHKMSTLVQWAEVAAEDVRTGKPIIHRLLTFRGDSDEAWQRAAAFIARELIEQRKVP